MVDSINVGNNPKAPVANSTKANQTSPVQRRVLPVQNDTVVISKKAPSQKAPTQELNKFQIAAIAVSTVATVALTGVFIYMSGIFKGAGLAKAIKKSEIPDEIKKRALAGTAAYAKQVTKLAKSFTKSESKLVDISKAKEILDQKIIGLDEVKGQVLDYLKVRNYHIKNGTKDLNKFILCLSGPPGVGKTSVAEAVAEAMGVKFERIGLSGIDKASQIVGHEPVWQGAEPGKIIKAMQSAESSNPLILLDEMDKLGNSQYGDPAAALLDVLEPKQCKHFTDNYLEFPLDLSDVNFVITANDLNRIPTTLKDRIHLIKIPPYSTEIKSDICRLELDKKMKACKVDPSKIKFDTSAITQIVKRGLDDDGKISAGARKALENLHQVFNQVLIALDENPKHVVTINDKFVDTVLDKYKTPLIKTNPIINEASVSTKANAENTPSFITRMFSKLRGNSNQ